MKNNPELDFYQSDAVHTVLKRYEFSESEKQIVQDAILSATEENMPEALGEFGLSPIGCSQLRTYSL